MKINNRIAIILITIVISIFYLINLPLYLINPVDLSYTGLFFLFLLIYICITIILIINKKKYFKLARNLIIAVVIVEIIFMLSNLVYFSVYFGLNFTLYDAHPILLGFALVMLSKDLN
jgi:hypothetical protein